MKLNPVSFHLAFMAGRTVADSAREDVLRPDGMDAWIVNYTSEGRGRVGRGSTSFHVETGDLLLFSPKAVHDYGFDPEKKLWVHLWAYFFPRSHWHPLLDWPQVGHGIGRLHAADNVLRKDLVHQFERMDYFSRSPLRRRDDFAMAALETTLLWCETVNPRSETAALDRRIQKALAYLCEKFAEPLSISRLAAHCGLSASRLSHLFRAEVGTTPMRYLENHRITQARNLLMMSDRPVAEIARTVGIRNPLYFTRLFKRATKCTPRDFRRQSR